MQLKQESSEKVRDIDSWILQPRNCWLLLLLTWISILGADISALNVKFPLEIRGWWLRNAVDRTNSIHTASRMKMRYKSRFPNYCRHSAYVSTCSFHTWTWRVKDDHRVLLTFFGHMTANVALFCQITLKYTTDARSYRVRLTCIFMAFVRKFNYLVIPSGHFK
jgi:hypothetical protein